jgi:hypothetical protein
VSIRKLPECILEGLREKIQEVKIVSIWAFFLTSTIWLKSLLPGFQGLSEMEEDPGSENGPVIASTGNGANK